MASVNVDIVNAFLFTLPIYLANASMVVLGYLCKHKYVPIFPINITLFGCKRDWLVAFIYLIISVMLYFFLFHQFFLGIVIGLGAWMGNLFNSFLKRRLGYPIGKSLPFIDQLDFIGGAIFAYYLTFGFFPDNSILIIILTLFLHPLSNMVAYELGLKEVWW